jgi:Uri superfamily endonuclease
MRLDGPYSYIISLNNGAYSVSSEKGEPHFTDPATSRKPKLYLLFRDSVFIYIGVTKQPLGTRIRMGMQADGKHGYHGYAWKSLKGQLSLKVWCLEAEKECDVSKELETIEAEVVHLFRTVSGQWPSCQTEIHFHESEDFHRSAARQVLGEHVDRFVASRASGG